MADKKISALPPASTPLAGTEVLPIVQGGTTDQVSVENLTAGRDVATKALTATQTVAGAGGWKIAATLLSTDFTMLRLGATTANKYVSIGNNADGTVSFFANGSSGAVGTEAFLITTAGNIMPATAGKGIDFSAATHAAGMTSELLNDYEEGNWTPVGNGITYAAGTAGKYTKVGNLVTCTFNIVFPTTANASNAQIQGLPFTSGSASAPTFGNYSSGFNGFVASGNTFIGLVNTTGTAFITNATLSAQTLIGSITYQV